MVGGGARVMVRADGRADGERGRQGLLEPVIRSSLIQSSQSFPGIKNDKVASKIQTEDPPSNKRNCIYFLEEARIIKEKMDRRNENL